MQGSIFDWSRPTTDLAQRIRRLGSGGPPGWRPQRLILQNYWLFDYEEFSFVQGRLVLRGANGTGKSTVLASAITLALDGDKRRERLDTFGGKSKSVADYLIGPHEARPGSSLYFDERTGYVALEFEHGRDGRYLTIGIGLHANRARPDGRVDFWGFVIRDGRRLGADLQLFSEPPQRVPLSARQLREALGSGGVVADEPARYQDLVNQSLFGFESIEQYRFLLGILLHLRSPKLNKDIKPSDVCDLLQDSLPPLDEDLLDQAAQIIEDIDACMEALTTTRGQLTAARALDDAQSLYLNQLAQQAALALRQADAELQQMTAEHAAAAGKLAEQQERVQALTERLAAGERESSAIDSRLTVLEGSEARRHQRDLETVDSDLTATVAALEHAARAARESEQALADLTGHREHLRSAWQQQLSHLRGRAEEYARCAEAAAWPLAQDSADAMCSALDRLSPAPDARVPTGPPAEALYNEGQERAAKLAEVLEQLRTAEAAEQAYRRAQAMQETARTALHAADAARQKAETGLEQAGTAAVSALQAWGQGSAQSPPEAVVAVVAGALLAYRSPETDPRSLLQPLEQWLTLQQERLEQQAFALRQRRAETGPVLERLSGELQGWLGRPEAEPPRRDGQMGARRLLAEQGITAVPLYAACEPVPDLPAPFLAALEANLEESGLLDALVVPTGRSRDVAAILGPAGLGDRWLRPVPAQAERTLADFLVPAPGVALAAADVVAALQAIAIGEGSGGASLLPAGGWQVGVLVGTATHRPEAVPLYLGAANRRRERERQVARLQAAVEAVTAQLAEMAAEQLRLERRRAVLGADLQRARALPELPGLQAAAGEAVQAGTWLESRKLELDRVSGEAERALSYLAAARTAVEVALRPVPEARGRTADGLRDLLENTRATVAMARTVGAQLAHLSSIGAEHGTTAARHEAERLRLTTAHDAQVLAAQRVSVLSERSRTLRELLGGLGVDVQTIAEEIGQLRDRLATLRSADSGLNRDLGEAREAVRRWQEEEAKLGAAREQLAERVDAARRRLAQRLQAYPTLARLREMLEAGPEGALSAAEELLRLRRSRTEELGRQIEESTREAWRSLAGLLEQHRSLLVDFHPELTDDLLFFREAGTRLLPCQLVSQLAVDQGAQEQVLREKEDQLYEEFILKQVASAVRERIERAEHWRDQVNALLEQRPLFGDERLSIGWRPLPPDRITGANTARVVDLLRRDVETLTDPEVQELTEHFRARVGEIRDRERRNELESSFAEALRGVLDYRQWFAFSLHARRGREDRVELTDARFGTRSGAEKALAMFIPLLAAAYARFTGAGADAPKLVGLDEAFAGVDEKNTREMFRFLVELDFSWIMTSEKLWGVADTLPGCATYELVRRGSVVTPILYVWDGKTRHGQLDRLSARQEATQREAAPTSE